MDQNDRLGGSAGSSGSGGATGGSGTGAGHPAAPDDFDAYDSHYYRRDFDARTDRPATHSYENARSGYQLGHTAAAKPNYQGRSFQEVEIDLEKEYKPQGNSSWVDVRDYVRGGFEWKTLLGGLAVAAGSWWAGKQVLEAFSEHSEDDETHYRAHYQSHPARTTVTYPQARNYYTLGYAASRNPEYGGRSYTEVEPEIRRGLAGPNAASFDTMRDFCRTGYERGTTRSGRGTTP
ncbi:MAG TPA: hypothetical protein VGB24_00435 [Longimicrobium sp.]|jgi:hypothetical protein|uniref:hypothetical protein n=1 Tax=Longimicrobium sp. TaxID=2029185 RepID=UPI002EDAED71